MRTFGRTVRKALLVCCLSGVALGAAAGLAACGDKKCSEHTWDAGTVQEASTCTKEGTKLFTCTVCKETKTEKTGKLPHDYTGAWQPSHDGHSHACSVCGEGGGEVVAHDFAEGEVIKEPTAEHEGLVKVTCSVCGYESARGLKLGAVKIKDIENATIAVAGTKVVNLSEYVTSNGNDYAVEASTGAARAVIEDGTLTLSGVSAGKAQVSVTCGKVTLSFEVTVEKRTPTVKKSAVTHTESYEEGGSYTIDFTENVNDPDGAVTSYEVRRGGVVQTLTDNKLTYSFTGAPDESVSYEVTVHYGKSGTVTYTYALYLRDAVKIKDIENATVAVAGSKEVTLTEYVTANGNDYAAETTNAGVATVGVSGDTLTVSGVSAGTAQITVTCGNVTLTFSVTVEKRAPALKSATVENTVNYSVGGSYTIDFTENVNDPDGAVTSYAVKCGGDVQTLTDNKLQYPFSGEENESITYEVTVHYGTGGTLVYSYTLTVTKVAPAFKEESVTVDVGDLYELATKSCTIRIKDNVNENGYAGSVVYTAKLGESDLTVTDGVLVVDLSGGSYDEAEETVTVTVTATYAGSQSLSATYTLKVRDTTAYHIRNGGFETGNLDGWTMTGTLGAVCGTEINAGWYTKNTDTKEGSYLFTYAVPDVSGGDYTNYQANVGTLKSSAFKMKKDGYLAFLFGGAGATGSTDHDVTVRLCKSDGTMIAEFCNDKTGKTNTLMNGYYYQYKGETCECYIEIVDRSAKEYGGFVVDGFRANLTAAPRGYTAAIRRMNYESGFSSSQNGDWKYGRVEYHWREGGKEDFTFYEATDYSDGAWTTGGKNYTLTNHSVELSAAGENAAIGYCADRNGSVSITFTFEAQGNYPDLRIGVANEDGEVSVNPTFYGLNDGTKTVSVSLTLNEGDTVYFIFMNKGDSTSSKGTLEINIFG